MRIIIIIFLLFSMTFAWSQERLAGIEVTGLKRTKESTVREIIKVEEGDEIDEGFTETVEQRLRKTGLFQDDMSVTLLPGPEGETLRISAKDRWTLIGMPFFSVSDGDMNGGFFAYESNLFGTQKILVTSLAVGEKSGVNGLVVYQDPSVRLSDYSMSLAFSGGKTTVLYTDLAGGEEWENYKMSELALSAGLGFQFNDEFLMEGTLLGLYRGYDELEENQTIIGLAAMAGYDRRYYHDLFASGPLLSLEGQTHWTVPGELNLFVKSRGAYGFVLGKNFLLQGSVVGGLADADYTSLYRLGGATGSRTLPAEAIATDRYVTGELLGEVRVLHFSWGSLTLPLFYEGGWLRDYQDESQLYHGIGGGMRVYLSKVTMPALGLDVTYNFTTEKPGLSFFLGLSY